MNCATCSNKICYTGKDCTGIKEDIEKYYKNETDRKIMESASKIEALYYMKATRLEEVILFSKEMDYKHLGIAFCVGFSEEARILEEIFKKHFKISSVCCKVCGIDKKNYNLLQLSKERFEAICDPIGQAEILNKNNTDLNIIVGLCIGHDILFTKHSKAPVTTLIVKDRVLSHNPVGAIYSGYYRRNFL
ncbi:MAG TPA: DUF1847 domain-containing protein [Candidatus Eremiobacteraeota bacterium]|nr:MAG: hypothetical protein BWY64_00538 [bacterium ADurb.Bin363]HPZ09278.1 DUF1847 domain-containing protein [Candidatus Eremiobacteraeota bacterium]